MTRNHAVSLAGKLEMTDAYRDDLAYIHDAGFGGFAQAAAPVLVETLRRNGIMYGLVIDLGCGSGILSHAISEAGYDVLGIDISDAMVAMARRRVPRGQFRGRARCSRQNFLVPSRSRRWVNASIICLMPVTALRVSPGYCAGFIDSLVSGRVFFSWTSPNRGACPEAALHAVISREMTGPCS